MRFEKGTEVLTTNTNAASSPSLSAGSLKPGVSSCTLKIVAIIAMTCNHIANVFASYLHPLVGLALYGVGGATFPIMAFLLVEGFLHTSNLRKYAIRLAIFAVVSQIPYSLLWGFTPNVLWTLLLSLGVLYAKKTVNSPAVFAVILVCAAILSAEFDWGLIGVVLVYLFYLIYARHYPEAQPNPGLASIAFHIRRKEIWLSLLVPAFVTLLGAVGFLSMGDLDGNVHIFLASLTDFQPVTGTMSQHITNTIVDAGLFTAGIGQVLYALVGFSIAGVLLDHYNGAKGYPLKWFFYAYYPAHLAVIWVITLLL